MKKKFNFVRLLVVVFLLGLSLIILGVSYYHYSLTAVSDNEIMKKVQIEKNTSGYEIALTLKKYNLIKSVRMFTLYLKWHKINNLKHGVYQLNEKMGSKKIITLLIKGTTLTGEEIDLLFREGINIRKVAKVIALNTNNQEIDVFNLLTDNNYLDSLIKEYWFLSEDIKNKDLYYPLEGYLYPNTYRFENENVKVETIFKIMLKEMDKVLSTYKAEIESSPYSIHQLLTLASIVESEGVNDEDRPKIAGVFYNRLRDKMPFGSCVTACYAAKMDGDCTPKKVPTKLDNPYNTYLSRMAGKLPIGPISLPSEASILATIYPENHDYYYFVADKYKKTYFTKNEKERNKLIDKLKKEGLWLEN